MTEKEEEGGQPANSGRARRGSPLKDAGENEEMEKYEKPQRTRPASQGSVVFPPRSREIFFT